MLRVERIDLPAEVLDRLSALQRRVDGSVDPKAEVAKLWRSLADGTRKPVLDALRDMSAGLERCMYCEDSLGTDIEHFRPKSQYPQHAFDWLNYLLACSHCNSNQKRSRFPLDDGGSPLLVNPSADEPADHLSLSPSTGLYSARSPRGSATIDVCGLNRPVCAAGRANAWHALCALIEGYARLVQVGDTIRASAYLDAMRHYPFQSVRVHLVRAWRAAPNDPDLLPPSVTSSLETFPELSAEINAVPRQAAPRDAWERQNLGK